MTCLSHPHSNTQGGFMKIKQTISKKDLNGIYDIIIVTFIAEMVMVALAMVMGVI